MPTIRRFHDEVTFEHLECDCIASYMRDNIDDFKNGFRLYVGQVDVTQDAYSLSTNSSFTMMRPALGPVAAFVPYIVAALAAVAVVLLTPKVEAPSNQSRSQSSATNSFGARTNEARPNTRVDDIWGKVSRHVPRLIQVPHVRYVDNVKSEHFAGYIGYGEYLQENIRDGDTSFIRLQNSKYNSWNPGGNPNSGAAPDFNVGGVINRPLVNVQKSRELNSQTELLPPNDLSVSSVTYKLTGSGVNGTVAVDTGPEGFDMRDFFFVNDVITFNDIFWADSQPVVTIYRFGSEGDVTYDLPNFLNVDLNGSYTITSVSQTQMIVTIPYGTTTPEYAAWQAMNEYTPNTYFLNVTDGISLDTNTIDDTVNNFNWFSDPGYTQPISVDRTDLFPSVGSSFDGTIGPFQAPSNVDTCVINLASLNGFYKIVQVNDTSVSINIRATIEETDSLGVPTGVSTVLNYTYQTASPSKTSPVGLTIDIPRTSLYTDFRISLLRTTNRDKSDNVSNVDKCEWLDLDFYFNIPVPDYGDITVFQCEIEQNNSTLSVKERQINLDVTRIHAPYIGGGQFGPKAPVDNVAETVIGLALHDRNGRLTLDEIDADLYMSVQQQLIDYYGNANYVKVGYDLDSTKLRFQDIYSLFWDAVNCRPYSQGAVYRVYPSIRRTDSSKQFTHRNKIIGTDAKDTNYNTENDGVELTYRSNLTGKFETVIRHANGTFSTNRVKIELSAATNEVQAITRANREVNTIRYQRFNYSFESDGIARLTVPGERVDNVDNTRIVKREGNSNTYEIYDGSVVAIDGLEAQLSQPVTFEPGENHTIRFTSKTGNLLEAIQCTAGQTAYHVILATSPSEPVYTGYKREKTTFTFASDASRLMLPVIIIGTKPKITRGLRTRTLTAINDDVRYYQNDQQFSGV